MLTFELTTITLENLFFTCADIWANNSIWNFADIWANNKNNLTCAHIWANNSFWNMCLKTCTFSSSFLQRREVIYKTIFSLFKFFHFRNYCANNFTNYFSSSLLSFFKYYNLPNTFKNIYINVLKTYFLTKN